MCTRSAAAGSDETRALAADLDNMISQLSALVESQRTFISHAAHELRSPLATLLGELQLALRRPRSADEYRRSLDAMHADVEALVRLAEDLLLLARVQAGAARPQELETVDTIVAEGLRMARGRGEERRVGIEVTGLEVAAGTQVQAVRGELARVLRNLVDNAIAHSAVDSARARRQRRRRRRPPRRPPAHLRAVLPRPQGRAGGAGRRGARPLDRPHDRARRRRRAHPRRVASARRSLRGAPAGRSRRRRSTRAAVRVVKLR
jgi:hypothetical protein